MARRAHAFWQPLAVTDAEVISPPMHFANIIRLIEPGEREVVSLRWGSAVEGDSLHAPTIGFVRLVLCLSPGPFYVVVDWSVRHSDF